MLKWRHTPGDVIVLVSVIVDSTGREVRDKGVSFHRATLCVSTILAVVRCPMSATLVDCIYTAEVYRQTSCSAW